MMASGTPGASNVGIAHSELNRMTPGGGKRTHLLLRILCLIFCVVGAVVMATDQQQSATPVYIPYLKSSIYISKKAYYSLFDAFKYLVWANALAAVWSILALIGMFTAQGKRKSLGWASLLMDQALAYLLLGAAASSTEVAYISKRGVNYIGWNEQCSNYGGFCKRVGISLFVTYLSTILFASLALLSAKRLFNTPAAPAGSTDGKV